MHRCGFVCLLGVLAISAAHAGDPPRPNLENPVDYIAWVNAEYGKGIRDNAADLYRQAAEKFVMHQATEDAIKDKKRSEWTEDDKKAIRAWATANSEAIGLFEQAAKKGDCFFELTPPEDGSMIGVLLPYLSGVRSTAKLMARRAYLDLLDGKLEGAVDTGTALLRAANHFQAQPHVITYLVGVSLRAIAYDLILQVPARLGDSPDYAAILTQLRANDSVPRNPERQFAMERVAYLDAAQRFLKDADGDGKLESLTELAARLEVKIEGLRSMTFDEVIAEGEEYYARLRAGASGTIQKMREIDSEIRERLTATGPSLAGILIPSLARAFELHLRSTAQRGAVRAVLGAHAFKAKNGRWPRDLKEATADESPGVRKDPYSGKELVYRVDGDSFLLYSVGPNFKDDEGKPASGENVWKDDEECDAVLWPLKP